ncbi:Beta-L-arabinofuranosidase GH127 [Rhizoctonia solani]|uniref:Beta-L-arabinofuranosidase GH127 n=1 Tax=Rhizoctonia solani TaxID=456999 RepID=A0A8H7HCD9_9AGAM|nr:Beta-L-arabinofuranosidase GH127 [Rhizoctonia solani]
MIVAGAAQASTIGRRENSAYSLSPKLYTNLNLGQIKPNGWLKDQLQLQADGLAGHLNLFYPLVTEGSWTGGIKNYSDLNEAGPYWFHGIIPLAYELEDTRLTKAVKDFMDYVLNHQYPDGWIGNETGDKWQPRHLWGRYPFFFGAIMMVEADPSYTDKFVAAFHKFVEISNQMLRNGQGTSDWTGGTRWQDYAMALQWLHDYHPNGKEELLVDTMQRIKAVSTNWRDVMSEAKFPTSSVSEFRIYWHGVNLAEGLKASGATYRFTHDETEKTEAAAAWDRLYKYHGRPSGIFAADEYLAGLDAIRGTELCLVVVSGAPHTTMDNLTDSIQESIYSSSYLYQVFGDAKYAERAEKQAYNSLPATISGDMWTHQYLQQQNQISVRDMSPNPFPADGCCTVNHPQGFPKFISHAVVSSADQKSLTQIYFGPLTVKTALSGVGAKVSINVDTNYPFSDNVKITINTDKTFDYYIRVPTWINKQASIKIGNSAEKAFSPDSTTKLQKVSVKAGTTIISLVLSGDITVESRPQGSVAIHRGPFNYALDIPRNSTLLNTLYPAEPRASDYQFDATASWNYAIDPSTLKFNPAPGNTALKKPIFDAGAPPLSISVKGCLVNWGLAGTTFVKPPPQNATCTGSKVDLKLIPFGATKLRISEFPVVH